MTSSITLIPYEGAHFAVSRGTGTVRFGDTAEQVSAVLGQPENTSTDDTLYFLDASVQVRIGPNGVEFIEFATNPEKEGVHVVLDGHELSQMNAIACAELLQTLNGGAELADDEAPESYAFEGLGLTVWQPVAWQDALDELNAAKANGDEQELKYLEAETKAAEHFDSVGIGSREYRKGYF